MGAESHPASRQVTIVYTVPNLQSSGRAPTVTDAAAAEQLRARRAKAKAARRARKAQRRRAR
jgi:hypothetical protein